MPQSRKHGAPKLACSVNRCWRGSIKNPPARNFCNCRRLVSLQGSVGIKHARAHQQRREVQAGVGGRLAGPFGEVGELSFVQRVWLRGTGMRGTGPRKARMYKTGAQRSASLTGGP